MHERYPGLNLLNYRHTAQLDRRCPRITPPTRHLTRADLARRSATILASEPPPEVIIGLVTSFQRLRSTSGVPKAPRPQLYGRRTQEPLPGAAQPSDYESISFMSPFQTRVNSSSLSQSALFCWHHASHGWDHALSTTPVETNRHEERHTQRYAPRWKRRGRSQWRQGWERAALQRRRWSM